MKLFIQRYLFFMGEASKFVIKFSGGGNSDVLKYIFYISISLNINPLYLKKK